MIEVRTQPVKDRHEVVADAFYARFAQTAYVFAVYFYVMITGLLSELDILVYRHAFDHFKAETVLPRGGTDTFNAGFGPRVPGRNIIDGGNYPAHAGYM